MSNPTRFASKPLIHIEGTGTVTVSINGTSITATDLVDYINIDCDRMDAYRLANENRNDKISGSFPTIAPGSNGIGITGSVTKVTITPRYFTI
jgi:phage-related protein